MGKVLFLKELINKARAAKRQGKTIVTYNGSFDIIHSGHVQSIHEAKSQGDVLFVLVNSDKSVRSYKGPTRPIIEEKERAKMISGVEGVDYVSIFNDVTPVKILEKIKPNVHCNGSDWGKNCVERGIVEKNGGRIHVLGWVPGLSTSKLIKRIIETHNMPIAKAVFLDRDGTINDNGSGYIYEIDKFKFLPGVIRSLKKLTKTNFKIIVVTNQSGIGRRYFSLRQYKTLTNWMLRLLKKEGILITKIYYCPHHPKKKCDCRKPKIGLFLKAVSEFGISLNDSWFIGDSESDVIAGRNANIKVIKLGDKMPKELKLEPNYYSSSLAEAVKIILG